ncbi:hypothetical protein D3C73_1280050 [compost metagenome]
MRNGAFRGKEDMIQPAQQRDQKLVINVKMNAEIGERPAVAALAGMGVSGSEQDQIPGPLRIAAVINDNLLLPFKHIVEFVLRVGMNWIIPRTAYFPQMHAEQVQRSFYIRYNCFTDALSKCRRHKS